MSPIARVDPPVSRRVACPPALAQKHDPDHQYAAVLLCLTLDDGRIGRVGPHVPTGQQLFCLTAEGDEYACQSILSTSTGDRVPMLEGKPGRVGPFTNGAAQIFCTGPDGVEYACGATGS